MFGASKKVEVAEIISAHVQIQGTKEPQGQDGITDILKVQQYLAGIETAYKAPEPNRKTPHQTKLPQKFL